MWADLCQCANLFPRWSQLWWIWWWRQCELPIVGRSAPGSRLGSGRDLPFSHVGEHSGDHQIKKIILQIFWYIFRIFQQKIPHYCQNKGGWGRSTPVWQKKKKHPILRVHKTSWRSDVRLGNLTALVMGTMRGRRRKRKIFVFFSMLSVSKSNLTFSPQYHFTRHRRTRPISSLRQLDNVKRRLIFYD